MFCEPLRGWRHVQVTQQRTRVDWAFALRAVLDAEYQQVERVVLVMDNLNTHSPAAFHEGPSPQEARRLTDRLEIHYTSKRSSWLNVAECELSVLGDNAWRRESPMASDWHPHVAARDRNEMAQDVNGQLPAEDARITLRPLYREFIRQAEYKEFPVPSKVYM